MKETKFMKILEWIIYIGLAASSMAYLWNVFTLFGAKDTSIKVKEIAITKQPIIVICTNEDNNYFGRHIDELKDIQLNYSSYYKWGDDPNMYKRHLDQMANHKVIKFGTAFSGTTYKISLFHFLLD